VARPHPLQVFPRCPAHLHLRIAYPPHPKRASFARAAAKRWQDSQDPFSMLPLIEQQIRASFINASLRERKAITLPEKFGSLDWKNLEFLGWRDPKLPLVGYLVTSLGDAHVGIMFRNAEGKIR